MTVKELIAKLQEFPEHSIVTSKGPDYGGYDWEEGESVVVELDRGGRVHICHQR